MSDSSPRVSIIMRSCNDSDVIRLTGQIGSDRGTDLTGAKDYNFHILVIPIQNSRGLESHSDDTYSPPFL